MTDFEIYIWILIIGIVSVTFLFLFLRWLWRGEIKIIYRRSFHEIVTENRRLKKEISQLNLNTIAGRKKYRAISKQITYNSKILMDLGSGLERKTKGGGNYGPEIK